MTRYVLTLTAVCMTSACATAAPPLDTTPVHATDVTRQVTQVGLRIAECVRARLMDLPMAERYELLGIDFKPRPSR